MSTSVVQRCEIYLLGHEPCKEGPLNESPVPEQNALAFVREQTFHWLIIYFNWKCPQEFCGSAC